MIASLVWKGAMAAVVLTGLAVVPAEAQSCTNERFEDARYLVCTVDPATADLQLFWRDENGEPYRTFDRLASDAAGDGRRLLFAMNAGMYRTDFSPVGLHVENGTEQRPANTTVIDAAPSQVPNFYKKPNGIFFLANGDAGILPTDEYLASRPEARFATQSGPMLVIRNELHPAFIRGSSDRTRRSGVGICESGAVRFAISDGRVNFDEFARLFRDHLACPDALFLDGGRGAGVYVPEERRNDRSWHGGFGPMLGLVQ